MPIITIYKMFNANRWHPVVKSHEEHQGLQSEQLRTGLPFSNF